MAPKREAGRRSLTLYHSLSEKFQKATILLLTRQLKYEIIDALSKLS